MIHLDLISWSAMLVIDAIEIICLLDSSEKQLEHGSPPE
jgi:hypothetical protein